MKALDEHRVKNQSRDCKVCKIHHKLAMFGKLPTWLKGPDQAHGPACLDECWVISANTQVIDKQPLCYFLKPLGKNNHCSYLFLKLMLHLVPCPPFLATQRLGLLRIRLHDL